MLTVKIDTAGHWLRADAAASYARMIAAGMPTGGVASAGRTFKEQVALWDAYRAGHGNLAARPGTSLHESGIALDVTRGTDAQKWMTYGADPLKVVAGEATRAESYGWTRTVPSEAWHFSYDPKADRHAPSLPPLTLRKGSIGSDVRRLQTALRLAGIRGDLLGRVLLPVDGIYGGQTVRAVKRWQSKHGLIADGICGPATWASLT